jgi:hypothetical protein
VNGNDVAADVDAASPSAKMSRRRLWIGALVLFLAAWAVALTYSVTAGGRSPERLDNADAQVADTACLDAQHAMAALPSVGIHSSVDARADRVASEDAILTTMLGKMLALRPQHDAPRTALNAWLDDWERLIEARQHYSNDLRTLGARARFVEPAAVGIQPVADKMNNWILEQGTRTDSCNTGRLQAEVVEGPRIYGEKSNS